MQLSSFTIFILIVIIVAAALGWRSGFMRQIGRLAGIVAGVAACRIFGPGLAQALFGADSPADTAIYIVLTYILLFAAVYIAVTLLAHAMRNVLGLVRLGVLDRVAGAVFRATEWLVFLSLLLNLWQSFAPVTSLVDDPVYLKVLWFGPYLLGTDAALKVGHAVSSAITG